MTHSKGCADAQMVHLTKIAAYEKEWPGYCHTCHGSGFVGTGAIDYDTGIADWDSCVDCCDGEIPTCPRCGSQDRYFEEICYGCGFRLGETEGIPEFECFCEEEQLLDAPPRDNDFEEFMSEADAAREKEDYLHDLTWDIQHPGDIPNCDRGEIRNWK